MLALLVVAIQRLLRLGSPEAATVGVGFCFAFASLALLAGTPKIDDLAHPTVTDFPVPRLRTMR